MVVVGGSYSAGFIEAEPVPAAEAVIVFNTESA